jgi:NAD(P)-dependent dehydrogenase (short-subunit alcohol dehydrogenase family)
MPLPDELLSLASSLANTPVSEATEAIYRRAISTAYYAAFHLLSEAAADRAAKDSISGISNVLQRHLSHGQMKKSAEMFSRGFDLLPAQIRSIVPNPVPFELEQVGSIFAWLQGRRHEADYSRSASFDRTVTINAPDRARRLFLLWETSVRDHPEYSQTFLISLFFDLEKKR